MALGTIFASIGLKRGIIKGSNQQDPLPKSGVTSYNPSLILLRMDKENTIESTYQ